MLRPPAEKKNLTTPRNRNNNQPILITHVPKQNVFDMFNKKKNRIFEKIFKKHDVQEHKKTFTIFKKMKKRLL